METDVDCKTVAPAIAVVVSAAAVDTATVVAEQARVPAPVASANDDVVAVALILDSVHRICYSAAVLPGDIVLPDSHLLRSIP